MGAFVHLWISMDVNIKLFHIDQWKDTGNKKWAGKTCAICCLKMLLVFKDKNNTNLKIMDLVKEGIEIGGLTQNNDWKHAAIVELASRRGVKMDYKKIFYYSREDKLEGLKFIESKLENSEPIIASIFNSKGGGHMVVVSGFSSDSETYNIIDPDSHNDSEYSLSTKEFITKWRGGLLWLL